MERFELAEELYRRTAAVGGPQGKLPLAALSWPPRIDVKGALDICEPLWTDVREVEQSVATLASISSSVPATTHVLLNRHRSTGLLAGLIERLRRQATNSGPISGFSSRFGNLREKQGDYAEAQKLYLRATKKAIANGIALNNLAWLHGTKDGKVKEALDYANRAIALKPDQPDFLDTRGMIYLANGKRELALEDLQRPSPTTHHLPRSIIHLAQAFLANNDKEKAKQSFGNGQGQRVHAKRPGCFGATELSEFSQGAGIALTDKS